MLVYQVDGGYSVRDIGLLELSGLETDFCTSVRVPARRHDDYSVIKRLVRQGEIDVELVLSEWGGKHAQTPFKEKRFDDINFMEKKRKRMINFSLLYEKFLKIDKQCSCITWFV